MIAVALMLAAATPNAERAIAAAMRDSATGWNAGDLARFMRVYADDAVYVTPRGLVRGRDAIARRYRASFAPGGNRRGRLTFGDTRFRALDPRHELMWARWTLTPPGGTKPASGRTTLVFERGAEGWRIVSDHSD